MKRLPDVGRRVRLNVRVDPEVRRRLDAFTRRSGFSTITEALEWLVKRGLRDVEDLGDELGWNKLGPADPSFDPVEHEMPY